MPRKFRPIKVDGKVAFVTLTQGYIAKIDADDVALVSGYNWKVMKDKWNVYAARNYQDENGKWQAVRMHRLIMSAKPDEQVDHKDHDGLNNRKENLRVCNQNQNLWNCRVRTDNLSGYKGVGFDKTRQKWKARIGKNGKRKVIGMFDTKEEAARAYEAASKELHGEYGYCGGMNA